MPPCLALLICTAFVLFLLEVERRTLRGVSTASWIPTLWMLAIASKPLPSWLGMTGSNESGSWLDELMLASLAILGIAILARRRFSSWAVFRQQRWLLVLLAYMYASTLWSEITFIALRRCVRESVILVMVLVVMSEANPRKALASVFRRSAYILLPFSLLLIKYYPLLGRQYGRWSGIEMWTGVTNQKNQLGRLCMICIFFLLWALYERWRERPHADGHYQAMADVAVVLLALYLLNGADSSTSLASLIVGVAVYLGFCWCRKLKIKVPQTALLASVIFLVGYGASAPFLGGSSVSSFSAMLGRDSTLTGRTEVWANVLPAIKRQPLVGYGFGSFWTDARRKLYEIPTAHNGYLDIMLELGEIGLALYTIWLLSCARQLHRALGQDYCWASLAICFLLMSLLYNTTESALNSLTEYVTAAGTLAFIVVANKADVILQEAKDYAAPVPHTTTGIVNVADRGVWETWSAIRRRSIQNATYQSAGRTSPNKGCHNEVITVHKHDDEA